MVSQGLNGPEYWTDENNPPFKIGDKVIGSDRVPEGSGIKKGQDYIISSIKWYKAPSGIYHWYVGVEGINNNYMTPMLFTKAPIVVISVWPKIEWNPNLLKAKRMIKRLKKKYRTPILSILKHKIEKYLQLVDKYDLPEVEKTLIMDEICFGISAYEVVEGKKVAINPASIEFYEHTKKDNATGLGNI